MVMKLAELGRSLSAAEIDKAISSQIELRTVQYGKPLKCIVHFVGGPRHDTEDEMAVTEQRIEVPRSNPLRPAPTRPHVPAFEYGTYRLVPVVVEGDTPVFAAVWEGWR